jgi:hypothetical protein
MNLGTMRTEVMARGYDYLSSTRVNQFLNWSYKEICRYMPWPFLETSATGASPLTITDLGSVLSVVGSLSDVPLQAVDRRQVLISDDDLNDTGTPEIFWLEGNVLNVWPGSSTDTVTVQYIKSPADLAADSDTPVIPADYHELIVDGAVLRAQKDNDNYDSYQVSRQVWQSELDLMVQAIMGRDLSGPSWITVTDPKNF